MKSTSARLERLEAARMPQRGALPHVVPDGTPDAELERLRAGGREVLTFTQMLEACFSDERDTR